MVDTRFHATSGPSTLSALLDAVNRSSALPGDADGAILIEGAEELALAGPNSVALAAHSSYAEDLKLTAAGAVAAYQEAFGGAVPDNALGIEYYQTLSATPDGWGKAREGLQTMLLRHPEDAHLNFALAQLETYREQSRRAGIDRLAAIAGAPAVGDNVLGVWRQALIWLQAEPADAPRYSRSPQL